MEWNENCTSITFNRTDYTKLSNGLIYLVPNRKIDDKIAYMIQDHKLLLWVNFSQNITATDKGLRLSKMKTTPKALQLVTLIGSIISMVSLIILLLTYFMFSKLRNLPRKIIINSAISLLL